MPLLFEGICPLLTIAVLNKCKISGIKTVRDFILLDAEELAKKIKTPYKDVLSIQRSLIHKYAAFPHNAQSLYDELLSTLAILNTGSESLNKLLNGGIYTGEITEIHGAPGAGKSQFCFSLVSNLIWETKSTALFLDTNNNFDAQRIEQILKKKSDDSQDISCKLQSVKVKYIYNIYELFAYLEVISDELSKQEHYFFRCMKLLVIDSITPLLSPCFGSKYLDGLGLMSNAAQKLNQLCCEHKLSILVCNNTVQGENSTWKPALGLNWEYVPSVSLCIDKLTCPTLHMIKAVKSCRSGTLEEVTFKITEAGVMD